jgi:glucosamine--fructose-6-phosphate aminotransferase (isomerizing)
MEKGINTQEEIYSQTKAWTGALLEVDRKINIISNIDLRSYKQILFTGCGSTYYLSLAAAALFQSLTGMITKAIPAGEMYMYPDSVYKGTDNLVFAISRSASTSETVMAVKQFKKVNGGKVVSVSNYEDQPLLEFSDLPICVLEGQEKSVAQTRSFCSMFMVMTAMAMIISGKMDLFMEMRQLPEIGLKLIKNYQTYAIETGKLLDYDRIYFLGSGCRYGLACEANLKMKEMALTHTEPFHFLEFRHGPKSMVNDHTMIFGLLSEHKRSIEEKVLFEMRDLGAKVISLSEKDADISFNSNLKEVIRNILYLPVLQMTAFYRSIAKGLDPDHPKNLTAVIYI